MTVSAFHNSTHFIRNRLLFSWLIWLLLMPVISWGASNANEARIKRVLAIHSYHRGYVWERTLEDTLDRQLHASDLKVSVFHETLDAIRFNDPAFQIKFYDYLRSKYRTARPDLIIGTDNAAFSFLVNYRNWLFGTVPVVFAGVNGFTPEQLLGEKNYTGVSEDPDMAETLKVALKCFPHSKRLLIYASWNQTYFTNMHILQKAIKKIGVPLKVERKENLRISAILDDAAKPPRDFLIVILSRILDDKGHPMSVIRSTELIAAAAKVPVISFWDFLLGHGIVGGKLVSAEKQATEAARMAVRILRAPPHAPLPAVLHSPNRYMFDYEQLKRFRVDLDKLPTDSVIINLPQSPWHKYRSFLTAVAVSISLR